METEARLVGQEKPLFTGQQVDILRLIGKGMARKEIVDNLSLTNNEGLNKKLAGVYKILGVSGETAAVQRAITLRILDIEELVDRDFDWRVFNDLNTKEKSILGAFIYAKDENLTDEEFEALNIKTTRDPKKYIQASVFNIYNIKLELPGKTAAVVYYRAFLEQEQRAGEKSSKPVLTETELKFLELAGQGGLTLTIAGKRLFENKDAAYRCRVRILKKLGVSSLEEAVNKAQDLDILPKKN